jgi:hypothetical protein
LALVYLNRFLLFSVLLVASWQLEPVAVDPHRCLYDAGYSTDFDWMVRRNSRGSEVYFYERPPRLGVIIVKGGGVASKLERPAEIAFLDDDHHFVAWTDDIKEGITFSNGVHRVFDSQPFDVDPSGRFFVAAAPYGKTGEIGTIANPMHSLAVTRLQAQRIFASDQKLFVLGWKEDRSLICEIYTLQNGCASLLDSKTLAGPNHAILDMDPQSEQIAIEGEGLFSWRLIDLRSGREKILGIRARETLFLQPSVMSGNCDRAI